MITIEAVCVELRGTPRDEIERWVGLQWVRPDGEPGRWLFAEIDVARLHLIRELRDEMRVNDDALPLVLSLMDQLYEHRRRLRRLGDLIRAAPEPVRRELVRGLEG